MQHGDILAAQHADDFGEPARQRRRHALEGFVEQQQARADHERARERHELLLAAAQRAAPCARASPPLRASGRRR